MIRYFSADPRRRREIIESLRERLAREDVAFAYLHGSFVELRFFRDIDVAVWARDPGRAEYYLVDLATSLTLDLGVPVDVQLLNGAPLPFRYRVLTKGVLLVSKDEDLRRRVFELTLREY